VSFERKEKRARGQYFLKLQSKVKGKLEFDKSTRSRRRTEGVSTGTGQELS